MATPRLRTFSTGNSSVTGSDIGVYSQIGGSDSDDSRSSISRSEDNERLPSIIYTSDDSADTAKTEIITDEGIGYIAHDVHQVPDNVSERLLLDSECNTPQPSQIQPNFGNTHPLAVMTFSTGSDSDIGQGDDLGLQEVPQHPDFTSNAHLGVLDGVCNYERSTSISSSSTGSSPEAQQPLLPEYQQLPEYIDYTEVEYEPLQAPPMPTKKMTFGGRYMVGNSVHIKARYQNAFYVSWNWNRIRQSCIILNISTLLSLLCIGTGLLIQMPRGSECNPAHTWWQGSVFYEIYVPSFKDSDADGIGDILGIISKLDYIEDLGVKGIRLNSVLQAADYLEDITSVTNFTSVEPVLGSKEDVELLAKILHSHKSHLYLMLDIPLSNLINANTESNKFVNNASNYDGIGLAKIAPVLHFWLSLGVDGFYFPDITSYVNDPGLVEAMHQWRNVLDQFTSGMEHKVMMVPLSLLETLKINQFPHLDHVLDLIDLIDTPVNLTGSIQTIPDFLNSTTAWDNHISLPWINWNMGGFGKDRIADLTHHHPLGRALFLLFLPGTVTLYYGDELALTHQKTPNWPSVMPWTNGENAGFSVVSPVGTLPDEFMYKNVEAQNESIATLSAMIAARQEKVPLYINGIFDYEGDYEPKKKSNYDVRYASDELLIIDRFYPRRNRVAIVANFGSNIITQDLSKFYFGGSVLASSSGQAGYIKFNAISLQPGEALACILDL